MNDPTEVTFSQVYNDVKGALSGVSDALKVGAEHVYEILVRQQLINSITHLIVILILSLSSYLGLKYVYKNMYTIDELGNKEFNEGVIPVAIICAFLFVFAIINACIHTETILTGFLNPEYGAIMEIKSFIKR
jgi:TRAP-type C4-dicarboxylate transport system permease small subunit